MTGTPKITQAMIDAYDEYTHLTLDRRGFMARLTGLAGSAAAAAAILPLIAASPARAAIVDPRDARLSTVWARFPAGDTEMRAYVAKPAEGEGPFPGVLVIHENRGLNAHIQDVARRFALDGFIAVAPDFLSSAGGTPPDEDAAREMIGGLDGERTVAEAVASREWLAALPGSNGKVGVVGFCWGGGLVNSMAVADSALLAGVAYYGRQPDPADAPKIRAALLLHYAGLDERINAGIEAYRAALEAAGVEHEIHVYEGVNHAFNNDTSAARYDKQASDLAFERTVTFLKEHLVDD
ncbi:dienelactone hydrolase family protein [Aurantimonas endophytica]|uniref:Carboxymethylenebutenolidase n=1 Tax=Aurantimonas endophytica TaxID=1522175 RepID=A0A7W6MNW7_9HYPH|nr:dienelactone hydrolase family protein [Aurantimonas endophytica]MBB4002267.1 carboxymethylenebutenolidase [Aurantimonas endophytica]MCO6402107.1 dienelactone hydrolase family protein [Aurantimonas endophytica]